MKKKAIEKVPFITVPQISRKKAVKYIAITAIKVIDHTRHLFLEVYKNKKASLAVPEVRYVATKDEYGWYSPGFNVWSTQGITKSTYYNGFIWDDTRLYDPEAIRTNILYSEDDKERIKNFFGLSYAVANSWWDVFNRHEGHCKSRERDKRYDNRRKRLEERMAAVPPLPEQELLKWADAKAFYNKHYLYYKKKGRKAKVCCSACGGTAEGYFKSSGSYESEMFETKILEPHNNLLGRCPLCGEFGTYKPQGHASRAYTVKKGVFMLNRYGEDGAVLRYLEVEKGWELEVIDSPTGDEMHGAYEKLEGVEIARIFYQKNKKAQIDYNKHNTYSGKDFWDDCNLYGMSNIKIMNGILYEGFYEEMEKTFFRYSNAEAMVNKGLDIRQYLNTYCHFPQIEMVGKMGWFEIAKRITEGGTSLIKQKDATRPAELFGIYPERVHLLTENEGCVAMLKVLQVEREKNLRWNEDQIKKASILNPTTEKFSMILDVMPIQKFINKIEKYAGAEIGEDICSQGMSRIRNTCGTYLDYMDLRQQLGFDLTNTVYQNPRDLRAAHDAMVDELNARNNQATAKEKNVEYPGIEERYEELCKVYSYEDGGYCIRPARCAYEIIQEGRTLHHCVGGASYLSSHNQGRTTILFLRFNNDPEEPYITVEVENATGKIKQWFGAHDKKLDRENMQKWLDKWIAEIKRRARAQIVPIAVAM